MIPTDRIHTFTGVALLLLAACLVINFITMSTISDSDPFDRDEIDNVLQDIKDNNGLHITGIVTSVLVDGVFSIAAAVGLYSVFRGRDRRLALLAFGFMLVASAVFLLVDGTNIAMNRLAADFKEGGPGGLKAGDATILEVARAVAITGGAAQQAGFTALSVAFLALGALLLWAPEAAGATPPRWTGWIALLTGVAGLLAWLVVLTGVAFIFFIISGLSSLVWLVVLGVWFVQAPEESAAIEPAGMRA